MFLETNVVNSVTVYDSIMSIFWPELKSSSSLNVTNFGTQRDQGTVHDNSRGPDLPLEETYRSYLMH